MKKIMIVMPELFHGGAEKQFRAIVSGLSKQEYEITVVDEHVYGNYDKSLNADFLQQNKAVKYIELKRRECNRFLKYLMINIDMILVLIRKKPDVVFSSSLKLVSLCKIMKIPFVYSERNAAEGDDYYREKRKALISSTKVTCNSESAQKELVSHGIKAQYIPNGIEECDILEQKQGSNMIIVPARISIEKNQEVVLDAMKMLPKQLKLILIGKISEKEYLDILKKKIRDINLEDRVELLEYTNDIKSLYEQSALVVLPSVTEGLSNVILESYMYGRICVLSDISQNQNASAEGQRFFEPHSAKMLYEKIMEVLSLNAEEYAQECKINHDYVVKNFGMKRMVEEYRCVFEEVMS